MINNHRNRDERTKIKTYCKNKAKTTSWSEVDQLLTVKRGDDKIDKYIFILKPNRRSDNECRNYPEKTRSQLIDMLNKRQLLY